MTDNLFYVLIFLCTLFFLQSYFLNSYADEPILISISSGLENIIFDGKWSNNIEWKHSSDNYLEYEDGTKIHLRTAHQGNFIYVHINVVTDMIINKGVDSAIVCFDTKNDKTVMPSSDDYCFSTAIDRKNSFTYQGSSIHAINGHFKKIPNHKDFIAVGSASDKYDRYNKTPHASYEFKIPLELLGRSNNYGFYISVFDGNSQNHYSYPIDIKNQSLTSISSPSTWGDLVSPDNSLPEFNFSILLYFLIPLMVLFTIITKFNLFKTSILNN